MWFSKTTRDRIRTNGAECKRTIRLTKINIVGHSKGGLDARIFLDITDTKDIANLIMMEHQMQVL
jgi:triacylglycerol esterase/lipase EstA (alpha/beta hydrolase family)